MAEPRPRGTALPPGAPKASESASAATSRVMGEPQVARTVRLTVRRTASTCGARASAGRGRGQRVPLVGALGVDPGIQADEEPLATGRQQQHHSRRRRERLRRRVRENRADRALRTAGQEPAQRHRGRRGHRAQQAAADQQAPVRCPDDLAQMRHPHRQHGIPEQDNPWEAETLDRPDVGRPAIVGQPRPRRERFGHTVGHQQSHVHQEPGAEQHDAPGLVRPGRTGAQRDDGNRRERG